MKDPVPQPVLSIFPSWIWGTGSFIDTPCRRLQNSAVDARCTEPAAALARLPIDLIKGIQGES